MPSILTDSIKPCSASVLFKSMAEGLKKRPYARDTLCRLAKNPKDIPKIPKNPKIPREIRKVYSPFCDDFR